MNEWAANECARLREEAARDRQALATGRSIRAAIERDIAKLKAKWTREQAQARAA